MSSSNRTASSKGGSKRADKSSHKADAAGKSDRHVKGTLGGDSHHTTKQHEADVKEKVRTLIEMSQRPEDEVCLALHECDNDLNQAMNMLLENEGHGEWEMRVKKKKNRQASTSKSDGNKGADHDVANNTDDWNDGAEASSAAVGDKVDGKGRKPGPGRLHGRHNDSRGWRGRERQENERNADERKGPPRTARGPAGAGGGRGGRGGGRTGGRFPPRNRNSSYNKPIETWDNNTAASQTQNHHHPSQENWGGDEFPGTDEWSTEEYTGSLADTKVFTPSTATAGDGTPENGQALNIDNAVINTGQLGQGMQLPPAGAATAQNPVQIAGTLSAAQTQYLNQLTQQNSDNIKQYGSAQTYHAQNATTNQYVPQAPPAANYSNNYANAANYQEQQAQQQPTQQQQQPRTKTQRARVPPPSKIPASAVEMPGDLNSSIGYLDVQFGAMDFMSETSSFDGVSDPKYGGSGAGGLDSAVTSSGNNDLSAASQNSTLDAYSPKSNTQSSISSALSQSLTNNDSIPQTSSEHLTSGYSSATRNNSSAGTVTPSSVTPSGLELSKQADSHGYAQQSYNSYQNKGNAYVTTYSGTQTSNTYASNQASSNNYASQNAGYNTAGGAGSTGGAYQNYSAPVTYQVNANSGAAGYPSITQASSYPSNNQSYQQNASANSNQSSVYGSGGAGGATSNASTNYGSSAATTASQYNNYAGAKLGSNKDANVYESTGSSTQTTSSTAATSQSGASASTKTTSSSSSLSKSSNSVVSNMPPGVAPPVMSTPYIMGQVPYFQQPVYSYEEMQLLQQRLPHMTTAPYYDMSYQTPPTTLAAVRDGSLGANVGYSMSSDGRYARADNNASPVPTTLSSQQTSTLTTQGHQAPPILTAGTGHPYFFTAALNTFPNYQFGAAMYTQVPAATNAHGSSNSSQYPKQAAYASAYNSYDTLSQTQDYNKTGGYVGNNQGQKGGGVNASSTGSSGNDLTAMYGKSHAALGKVNSYDKQGFHSGTPPPFTGNLHGGQNAGLAPSGTGYGPQVYIPALAPHQQQISTQLMHQPLHQDSANSSGQRSQSTNASKGGAKQAYQNSYWNPA